MQRISVCVFKRAGRQCYEAQWTDPTTGRKKTRSTGTDRKREAERIAGNIEQELRSGTFREPQRVAWSDFRKRYECEEVEKHRIKTQWKYKGTLNLIESIIQPETLAAVNEAAISRLAAKLREQKREEPTIRGHLTNLRKLLRWAHGQKLLAVIPHIEMPETSDPTGRDVTLEEFERMLGKVRPVACAALLRHRTHLILTACRKRTLAARTLSELAAVDGRIREIVRSWEQLLYGLWWSGLRLDEALNLSWDDDRHLMVDFTGKRPMLRIRARGQKNGRDSLTPMAPEFAEFMQATPVHQRTGYVFSPHRQRQKGMPERMRSDTASKLIGKLGERAGVKVGEYDRSGRVKYAGAHDLRRSFGVRWAGRVLPPVLKELMRHSSIETTMRYYVRTNAEKTAEAAWDAIANAFTNSVGVRPEAAIHETTQAAATQRLGHYTRRESNP